jgi:NTE family protein
VREKPRSKGFVLEKLQGIRRAVTAFGREMMQGHRQQEKPFVRPKIGIALGGGFARGVAHVGVLRVLEDEGIPVDYIAGTSSGAVIGAMYASGMSGKDIHEVASLLKFGNFAKFSFSRLGFWNSSPMATFLKRVLKADTFEQLRMPLAVSATEFTTGEPVIFSSGPLIDAVRASCAYPGMFHPVQIDGRLMVDGLLSHPVPAVPLKQMGAEKVIAVYFSSHWVGNTGPKHFMDVIGQCFSIASSRMCEQWQSSADLVLEPDVSAFAYDAFAHVNELVKVGEEAARAALPQIRDWITDPATAEPAAAAELSKSPMGPATVPVAG